MYISYHLISLYSCNWSSESLNDGNVLGGVVWCSWFRVSHSSFHHLHHAFNSSFFFFFTFCFFSFFVYDYCFCAFCFRWDQALPLLFVWLYSWFLTCVTAWVHRGSLWSQWLFLPLTADLGSVMANQSVLNCFRTDSWLVLDQILGAKWSISCFQRKSPVRK